MEPVLPAHWSLAAPGAPLPAHDREHLANVGSQEVIHLVSQGRLTEQLAPAHQVPDGDMEVRVATAPVGDLGKGMSGQDVLGEQREPKATSRTLQPHSPQLQPGRRPQDRPQALRGGKEQAGRGSWAPSVHSGRGGRLPLCLGWAPLSGLGREGAQGSV